MLYVAYLRWSTAEKLWEKMWKWSGRGLQPEYAGAHLASRDLTRSRDNAKD